MMQTYRTVTPPPGRCPPAPEPDRERRIRWYEREIERMGQASVAPKSTKPLTVYRAERENEIRTGTARELAEAFGCKAHHVQIAGNVGKPLRGWSVTRIGKQ